jgi:hypothetical protein
MFLSSLRRWVTGASRSSRPCCRENTSRDFKPRLELLEDRIVPAWTVNDLTTVTAASLVQDLVGVGVSVSNIQYTGAKKAAGSFTDTSNVTGISSGIILSSGSAKGVVGPNNSPSFSTKNGTPGDPQLNAIISPQAGFDASVLQFDFVPQGNILSFSYVFGSEEYPEFVNSINDVFAFFLNGKNVALIPGSNQPVSINNLNNVDGTDDFPKYYVDNFTNASAPYGTHDTQMDGYTTVLPVTVSVTRGQSYHIKLAIEDAVDSIYDSWVLIKAGSLNAPNIGVYGPLRYAYQASTGLYYGSITAFDYSSASVSGPLYLVFNYLPTGVTVANATGKTKSGKPYVLLTNGTLQGNSSLHVTVYFKNPFNTNLGSFFSHYPIAIMPTLN